MPKNPQLALKKGDLPRPGDRFGVALSGGADSVALLVLLHDRANAEGFQLTALHVNHGLRGAESDADEAFAVNLAQKLGILIRVSRPKLSAGNLEQAARRARYAWFLELIRSGELDKIATGHTASDQAETVLFRFLRGSGTAGLAGIRPSTEQGIIRPLLEASREEVREYLTSRNIPWREDSSNTDPRFARNRIRMELLPGLTRGWNPSLPQTLVHTAEWARAEEEYWAGEMQHLAARHIRFSPGAAILSASELKALPLAAARRLVRFAIQRVKGDLRQIDFVHIERILGLSSDGRVQVPGIDVSRSFHWLRLAVGAAGSPEYSRTLEIPACIAVPHYASLQMELKTADSVYYDCGHQLDWGHLTGSLELRSWRSGDCYRRPGHLRGTTLKLLFQKARVPAWERRTWPVITCDNSIVWVGRFGPEASYARSAATRMILLIREISPETAEVSNQKV